MSAATQQKFQKLVRKLGRLIRAVTDNGLAVAKSKTKAKPQAKTPHWASAYLDARWFADAEGNIAKLRVVLPNGKLYGLLRVTSDMQAVLRKVGSVREANMSERWYGLKVTVSFDGVVTTDLNNDPNCVVDPTWFNS